MAALIDKHLSVLKLHLPYHESDHVLVQALKLCVGGTCLEDMMQLQGDEAVLRMLGACRLLGPMYPVWTPFARSCGPGSVLDVY